MAIAAGWRFHSITPWGFSREEPKMLAFRNTMTEPIKSVAKETIFWEICGNFVAVNDLIPKAKPMNMKISPPMEPIFSNKALPGATRLGSPQQKKERVKKKNKNAKFLVI